MVVPGPRMDRRGVQVVPMPLPHTAPEQGNSSLCCVVTAPAQPFLFWVGDERIGGANPVLMAPLVGEKFPPDVPLRGRDA
jgi:hypothetical protein